MKDTHIMRELQEHPDGRIARFIMAIDYLPAEEDTEDGGPGSGNWGHKGRIGKRGGSGKGGGRHNRQGSKEEGFSRRFDTERIDWDQKNGNPGGMFNRQWGWGNQAEKWAPKPKKIRSFSGVDWVKNVRQYDTPELDKACKKIIGGSMDIPGAMEHMEQEVTNLLNFKNPASRPVGQVLVACTHYITRKEKYYRDKNGRNFDAMINDGVFPNLNEQEIKEFKNLVKVGNEKSDQLYYEGEPLNNMNVYYAGVGLSNAYDKDDYIRFLALKDKMMGAPDPQDGEQRTESIKQWNNVLQQHMHSPEYAQIRKARESGKPYRAGGEIKQKIGVKHYIQVSQMVDKCKNVDVQCAWDSLSKNIRVGNIASGRDQYCDWTGRIFIDVNNNSQADSCHLAGQVTVHESFHSIDHMLGEKLVGDSTDFDRMYSVRWNDREFPNTIQKEVDTSLTKFTTSAEKDALKKENLQERYANYMALTRLPGGEAMFSVTGINIAAPGGPEWRVSEKDFISIVQTGKLANGRKPHMSKQDAKYGFVKSIAKELENVPLTVKGDLSDILQGALVMKTRPLGVGHDSTYYTSKASRNLAAQAFAEFADSQIANPKSLALLKKYLPQSYDCYCRMMKDAQKFL